MRVLSVITPSYKPEADHLLAAYESLKSQEMPVGWSWEWLIQEDGRDGEARQILPEDERVKIEDGRHLGVALTRNLALSRAAGEFVKNFDQDDLMTAGVLSRDIAVLTANDDVHWTTSRVLDLYPDGSKVEFEHDPGEGRQRRGLPLEHWRTHNYRLPIHPTTICIRRELAVALGGWMAVPGSDDTGMLLAASALSDGWFSRDVGLLYRKWPGQETANARHTESGEWHARMHLIGERADALARTGWAWKPGL